MAASTAFARKVLEKYGWREGKGLGKSEDGITTPIKPRIKLDTYGVGHKVDLTSDWWCQSFNKAAQSLEVHISEDSVIVKKNKDKAEKSSKIPDSKAYNAFIKNLSATFLSNYLLLNVFSNLIPAKEQKQKALELS